MRGVDTGTVTATHGPTGLDSVSRTISAHELVTSRVCAAPTCLNDAAAGRELCEEHERDKRRVVRTPTSLRLPEGLSFADWRAVGDRLMRAETSVNWWLGDWLCYGERYRRDYRGAMEQLDYAIGTLRNCAYVAANVPAAMRRSDLSWTHHRIVAPRDPEEQEQLLAEAALKGWSVRELEQRIRIRSLGNGQAPEGRRASPSRPPELRIRDRGHLLDLCQAAARHAGQDVRSWAAGVLEQAARAELNGGASIARAALEAAAGDVQT